MNDYYIAGLFDGSGSMHMSTQPYKDRVYHNPLIVFSHTNKSTLEEVQKVLGYGHIYRPKVGSSHRLKIYKRAHVLDFLARVRGKVLSKREAVEDFAQEILSRGA